VADDDVRPTFPELKSSDTELFGLRHNTKEEMKFKTPGAVKAFRGFFVAP
jgi:hypothetical protein